MPAVARVGDKDSSNDTIIEGSPDVFVNGGSGGVASVGGFAAPEPPLAMSYYQKQQTTLNRINVAKYNTPDNIENGVEGHPEVPDDPAAPAPPAQAPAVANPNCTGGGGDLGAVLDQRLTEAASGQWRETGTNPNILACSADVGIGQHSDSIAWCAAFAGSTLKNNCFKFLKTLSAGSYTGYGNPISIDQIAKGDVVVFNRHGGSGHVAFYYGPGPRPGTITVVGGNQSDNITKSIRKISELKANGIQRPIPV